MRHQRIQQWAAQTSRSPEKCGPRASERMYDDLRRLDLAPQRGWRITGKSIRMPVAMVLHAVPAADDIAHDLWVGSGTPADAEEAGLGSVPVQQIQHLRRHVR